MPKNAAWGTKSATKIISYAQKVLLPDPDLVAIRCELLQHDLVLLEAVAHEITLLETCEQALVSQTPYQIWTQLRGFSTTQVASLAAALGDPRNYGYAGQVFRRSGLVSGRNDSGVRHPSRVSTRLGC